MTDTDRSAPADPFTTTIPVRYRDLDTFGHVNNAVYATYLETARTAYFDRVLEITTEDVDVVLAALSLDFERSITAEDDPEVAVWSTDLGTTSWRQSYELRVGTSRAATGETTLVFVDSETMEPTSMPVEIRDRIVEYEGIDREN